MNLSRFLSNLFVSWIRPLLTAGSQRKLTLADFPVELGKESVNRCADELVRALEATPNDPLSKTLGKVYRGILSGALLLGLLHAVTSLALPFLLQAFLNDLSTSVAPLSQKILLALSLFSMSLLSWLLIQHCFFVGGRLALRVRAGLVNAIYKKLLGSSPANDDSSSAYFNLIARDALKVGSAGQMLVLTVMSLVLIVGGVLLLYQIVGVSSLAGFLVLVLLAPLYRKQARAMEATTGDLFHISDRRVGFLSVVFQGIRAIKLAGVESILGDQARKIRAQELVKLNRIAIQTAFLNLLFQSSPIAVALVTFTTAALLGRQLGLPEVLSALATFAILRAPLLHLPNLIVALLEGRVSLNRIELALRGQERLPVTAGTAPLGSVSLKAATFSWKTQGKAVLSEISLEITPGELVAVLGPAGSGKSSLLHALLGEMGVQEGEAALSGEVSYSSQQPWMVNSTVKENIVFGAEWNSARYSEVISVTGLERDLAQWASGDATEAGENGLALSGGQRQRIALARALYRNADLCLLDDPFSSLDNRTATHCFEKGVLGFLKGATRILVTHRHDFAQQADVVLWIKNGRIVRSLRGQQIKKLHEIPAEVAPEPTRALERAPARGMITAEADAEGSVPLDRYRQYGAMLGSSLVLALILGIFLLREVFNVGADTWISYTTARAGITPTIILSGFALLGLLTSVATYVRSRMVMAKTVVAAGTLHEGMLSGVLNSPFSFFEANPLGRLLNRFGKDQAAIDLEVGTKTLECLNVIFLLGSSLILIVVATPVAVLVMFPLGVVYYRLQLFFRATSRQINRMEALSQSPLFAHVSETQGGLTTIRAMRQQDRFRQGLSERLEINQRILIARLAADRWLSIHLDSLGALLVGITAVLAACFSDAIGWELAGLSVTHALAVTVTFARAVHTFAELECGMNSVERVQEYAGLPGEGFKGNGQPASPPVQWPDAGRVEIKDLELRYRPDLEPSLKDISFTIGAGEKLGVIGRTGSGKSSLLLAIFRLVEPTGGNVFIDGIDVKTLPLAVLRSRLAILPQEPVLFPGPLRSSLDLKNEYSDSEIWKALNAVQMKEAVESLPGGLSLELQPDLFSLGQRQLLCLARVILRKPKILFLDEATANLDPTADKLVQDAVEREFAHSTVITIAHRLQTLSRAHRIVVMQDGRVAEIGTPTELSQKYPELQRGGAA